MTLIGEPFPYTPSHDARKVYEIEFRCLVIDRSYTVKGDGDGDHYGTKVGKRICHVIATSGVLANAAWTELHGPGRMGCAGNEIVSCQPIAAIDGEMTMRGHR